MAFKCGNTERLATMLVLVVLYFFVELVVGIAIQSLSLVADSFHMFSDCLALAVGIAASQIAKWPRSSKNTFGWQRAEVMGSLINTIVLITLCMTIFLRAIERFIETEPILSPDKMVYVGLGGLFVNILGLVVLGAHSHAGSHNIIEVNDETPLTPKTYGSNLPLNHKGEPFQQVSNDSFSKTNDDLNGKGKCHRNIQNNYQNSGFTQKDVSNNEPNNFIKKNKKKHSHAKPDSHSMNMRAVFLHVLADFLGSIIVVISALIIWLVPDSDGGNSWKVYIDPAMSILMVIIILVNAIPLMYNSALILLQSVPSEICLKNLKMHLENIDGIHKIHDLHVWRLQSSCIIGTVHIRCVNLPDYLNIARQVKQLFHEYNIHCTTIQPEFEEGDEDSTSQIDYQACVLDCGPNKNCQSDTCCPVSNVPTSIPIVPPVVVVPTASTPISNVPVYSTKDSMKASRSDTELSKESTTMSTICSTSNQKSNPVI